MHHVDFPVLGYAHTHAIALHSLEGGLRHGWAKRGARIAVNGDAL